MRWSTKGITMQAGTSDGQLRHPAGAPASVGGRFAAEVQPDPAATLDQAPRSIVDGHLDWLRRSVGAQRRPAIGAAPSLRQLADLADLLNAAHADAARLTFSVDVSEESAYYDMVLVDGDGDVVHALDRDERDVVTSMLPSPAGDDDAYSRLGVDSSEETDWMDAGHLDLRDQCADTWRREADVIERKAIAGLIRSSPAAAAAAKSALEMASADLASEHLRSIGHRVVDRDWHCRQGSVPIVARDGATWVFVTHATESVDRDGLRRMRTLATLWMQAHDVRGPMRIDQIIAGDDGSDITHVKGIR